MSDDESFIARWSRRKRSPEAAEADEAKRAGAAGPPATAPAEDAAAAPEAEPAVELASLPPLDSIGPDSDVSAFLAPGVPANLTRAALRRAWSSDPEIRDFIGLVENGWDFNAPDGAPGFGTLTAEEARRLFGLLSNPGAPADPGAAGPQAASAVPDPTASGQEQPRQEAEKLLDSQTLPQRNEDDIAPQQNPQDREYTPILPRPGHGGAVPR
jgi:hypothetical protein